MGLSLKPDIILMDIKLKDNIDGIDAAKTIQLNYKIPVIFLTAYGTPKAYKKVKYISDYIIIQKPYKIEEIDKAIRKALGLD
jgi:two-component SAPR family response regulator